jgi:hypothetical protein
MGADVWPRAPPNSRGTAQAWRYGRGTDGGQRSASRGAARHPSQKWLAFLQNHREGIAAFDFFTVPTVWLLGHRAPALQDSRLQRNPTSDCRMDGPIRVTIPAGSRTISPCLDLLLLML